MIYAKDALAVVNTNNSCKAAIEHYEHLYQIPKGLLGAISKVESGHNPLALGDGVNNYNFKTKDAVLVQVNQLLASGKSNFDLGCMQLNYYWHRRYFSSVAEMLEARANVRYAAGFLLGLYKQHASWHKAVRYYHSNNANYYKKYSRKVSIAWLSEEGA